MKSILKAVITLVVILIVMIVGIYMALPQVLFSFPMGQRLLLTIEGDDVAHFFFKNDQEGDTLVMEGVIYSNTLEDITDAFERFPGITTLSMVDVPGSVDDEINLLASREIRKRNINTYVPENGVIASGGTDMFLAGKRRAIHSSAKLGVHSWGTGGDSTALDFPRDHHEHQKYLDYYVEMNIPADFYWYTLEAAPAEDIHWMTKAEIEQYAVVTTSLDLGALLTIQRELSSDEFEGREAGKNARTQELIRNFYNRIDLRKFNGMYDQPFTFADKETDLNVAGTNLVGYVPGTESPDQYIVLSAHFDHLGIREGLIYNGADDNASGTSALLILAQYFSINLPSHSIIFCAFDAEEKGLKGANHFVETPPVPLSNIMMNVNFDMISRNPQNEIYVVGTYDYPQFKPLIENIAITSPLNISYGHDDPSDTIKKYWMNSSDNGAFFEKDIPNITFSVEDHPGYHKPEDDFEHINPDFYQNVVKLILSSIQAFDRHLLNP